MALIKPSPELSARIQALIVALDPEPTRSWTTYTFKKDYNALPLHYFAGYLWAIKPDGTLLCLDLDSSRGPEVETNPEQIKEVILNSLTDFPELKELLPD